MITTHNVNGRADWYQASATYKGVRYSAFHATRHAAFLEVLRQMAVKGYCKI